MTLSVIVPSYNRKNLLKRALDSVLEAKAFAFGHEVEIIVVDDASCDDTRAMLAWCYPSVVCVVHDRNLGVAAARNTGLQIARHEWILFLDSDDEWHGQKLKSQIQLHQNHPSILVSHTAESWIRHGKVLKQPTWNLKASGDLLALCLKRCIIAPSSVMIHRKVFEHIGCFDPGLVVCEDYDLWLRVSSAYEIGLVDKPLVIKYDGHVQLSHQYWGMDRFRMRSLCNYLKCYAKAHEMELVKSQIQAFAHILLKGAKKHGNAVLMHECEKVLREVFSA